VTTPTLALVSGDSFGVCYLVSSLTHLCSGTFEMLSVTHFTETLLEAVEDELKVRGTFSYL
jgi:hypothetical protein